MTIRMSIISLFLLSSPALYGYPCALNYTTDEVRILAELCSEAGHRNSSLDPNPTTTLDADLQGLLKNPTFDTFSGRTGNEQIFLKNAPKAKFGSIAYGTSLFNTPQGKEIIVTLPGTQSKADASSDLTAGPVTLNAAGLLTNALIFNAGKSQEALDSLDSELRNEKKFGNTVQVHRGFSDAYLSTKKEVVQTIKAIKQNERIADNALRLIVTGHSLGGAMATLAALDLWHTFFNGVPNVPDNPVTVVTFGAPAVFKGPVKRGRVKNGFDETTWDNTVAPLWDNSVGKDNILRLVDYDDPIPPVLSNSYQEWRTSYYHQLGLARTIDTRGAGGGLWYGPTNLTRASSLLNVKKHFMNHYIYHLNEGDFDLPVRKL